MNRIIALGLAAIWALASMSAQADDDSRDKVLATSAVGYTVISRVYTGEDSNLSYLRFLNRSSATATVNLTFIGSPTGTVYNFGAVTVAANTSRQFSITQLLNSAGFTGVRGSDTRMLVYMQSTLEPVSVQHVLYNPNNGFFENLSVCQNSTLSNGNTALVNVHTTRIADYTSFINIHNYGTAQEIFDVSIYESETGTFRGSIPITLEANTTVEQPMSWFQDQVGWTPSTTTFHANLVVFPRFSTKSSVVTHTVYNAKLLAYLNLTQFCDIESTVNTLPFANNDSISGLNVGTARTIQFTTLTANDTNAVGATMLEATTPRTGGTPNGTLTLSNNNATLTPARAGVLTFQYRIRNGSGDSNFATVTVDVNAGLPVAVADTLTQKFTIGQTTTINLPILTANDTNAITATLEDFTTPTNGTVTKQVNNLTFTPVANGTVTFDYRIRTSAGLSNFATITLSVTP
jgi:hypothetical protein